MTKEKTLRYLTKQRNKVAGFFSVLSDGFSIKVFIAKLYSQHLNFKRVRGAAWIWTQFMNIRYCSQGIYLLFIQINVLFFLRCSTSLSDVSREKKFTTLLVSTASPRPDKTIKSASRWLYRLSKSHLFPPWGLNLHTQLKVRFSGWRTETLHSVIKRIYLDHFGYLGHIVVLPTPNLKK